MALQRRADGFVVGDGVSSDLELFLLSFEVLAQVRRYPMQNERVFRESRRQTAGALDSPVVFTVNPRFCQPLEGKIAIREDVNFSPAVLLVLFTLKKPRKYTFYCSDFTYGHIRICQCFAVVMDSHRGL